MLFKSVTAGVLALGLFTAALSLPQPDSARSAVVETEAVESTELAKNSCCAKRAYCCTIKRSCCGNPVHLQNHND